MKRITASLAMACVAIDCGRFAVGLDPQTIFAPNLIWIWGIFAVVLAVGALEILLRGVP
jgi:hypothetical protein